MNAKSTAIWIIVAVAVLGGIYGLTYLAQTSPAVQSGGNVGPIPPVTASDWIVGNPQASTTLIEYGDFECPVCSEYAPLISQLMQQFGGNVRFVYRFFPLESIHPNAAISAAAAQAAGEQGKFWEMHDLLFKNQNDWATLSQADAEKTFDGYAQTLGLNVSKFTADMNSASTTALIAADYQNDINMGLSYTPTFILNGRLIPNPQSSNAFVQVLQQAIGK